MRPALDQGDLLCNPVSFVWLSCALWHGSAYIIEEIKTVQLMFYLCWKLSNDHGDVVVGSRKKDGG